MTQATQVIVTGATGFVGRSLMRLLAADGFDARGLSRANGPSLEDPSADWSSVVRGAGAVVHTAAMVHVMNATAGMAEEFRRVNATGSARLAEQAAANGVRRFVYLSSVKAHGESGALTESSPRNPTDAYGQSKRDAEDRLFEIGARTGMEIVVIRPPLVYGPGVRANFSALAGAVRKGVPLPLGAVRNRRSLVGLDNLVDFIQVCLRAPAAAGEAFLVSDGDDLSTPELIRRMARAMGTKARLVPVPVSLLRTAASVLGRSAAIDRLAGSLTLDITKARTRLGWNPPSSVDAQLARMFAS